MKRGVASGRGKERALVAVPLQTPPPARTLRVAECHGREGKRRWRRCTRRELGRTAAQPTMALLAARPARARVQEAKPGERVAHGLLFLALCKLRVEVRLKQLFLLFNVATAPNSHVVRLLEPVEGRGVAEDRLRRRHGQGVADRQRLVRAARLEKLALADVDARRHAQRQHQQQRPAQCPVELGAVHDLDAVARDRRHSLAIFCSSRWCGKKRVLVYCRSGSRKKTSALSLSAPRKIKVRAWGEGNT